MSKATALAEPAPTAHAHCAAAAPEFAHLLRRRAAWLLGWMLKLPHFVATAAPAAGADSDGAHVHLMYSMLAQLLTDEHAGVSDNGGHRPAAE